MTVLSSTLDKRSDRFAENAERNRALADDLHRSLTRIEQGGDERSRAS